MPIGAGGFALPVGSGDRILVTAILPRRTAHDFLKCFSKGACGFVPEGLRDFGNGIAGIRHFVPG